MSELSREERWRAARARREAAVNRHPFLAGATMSPEELVVIDPSSADEPLVLVAFSGASNKLGIPVSKFFDAVRVPCHRVLIRGLALPISAHPIGEDVKSAVEFLDRLVDGRPALFVGNSLGGFQALLLATLCEADRVLAVNPATSMLPENIDVWDGRGYRSVSQDDDIPTEYYDIPTLWASYPAVPTNVHFGYRDSPYRRHAEHIAEFDNVELTAYYQYQPMYELLRTGRLGPLVDGLLKDVAPEAVSRLMQTRLPS